jgi:hypothetical protein
VQRSVHLPNEHNSLPVCHSVKWQQRQQSGQIVAVTDVCDSVLCSTPEILVFVRKQKFLVYQPEPTKTQRHLQQYASDQTHLFSEFSEITGPAKSSINEPFP